jgi:Zn finger protein HypA/HybF involved in hydrogenase expression
MAKTTDEDEGYLARLYEGYEILECQGCGHSIEVQMTDNMEEMRCPECGLHYGDDKNEQEVEIPNIV